MTTIMSEFIIPEQAKVPVDQMKEWLRSQPHLPQPLDVGDLLLVRFVHSCYYDLEKAKTAAELFFTIRGNSPELMSNRDPHSAQMQKALKIVNLAQLRISGNRFLWIWQINDPGLEKYDYVQDAKMSVLSTDAWLMNNTEFEEGDVILMDVKDISLKFLTKFNVSVAKKLSKYQEDAMPIRLKQIHVVNAPSAIDKIYMLMKPFLKQEITNMIHFHSPKSDSLTQYLGKEDLPEDYGGTNGRMEDHMKNVMDVINKHRDRLNNPNLWTAIVKNKKNKKDPTPETSFRSLAID